jgi:5-formyltetrahydrofolate cyclo-ligase
VANRDEVDARQGDVASGELRGSKDELRRRSRHRRRALSSVFRGEAEEHICEQLLQHPALQTASLIGGYSAFDGEVDLSILYQALRAQTPSIKTAFPIHTPDEPLRFYLPERWTTSSTHRYKLPVGPEVDLLEFDVMLVPGLAFGPQGARVGFGGGFYDRTLSRLQQRGWSGVAFGVGFSTQWVERLDLEPWDMPLKGMITERGWFW